MHQRWLLAGLVAGGPGCGDAVDGWWSSHPVADALGLDSSFTVGGWMGLRCGAREVCMNKNACLVG